MERANSNKVDRILGCAATAVEIELIAGGMSLSPSLTSMGLAGAAAAKLGSAAPSGAAGTGGMASAAAGADSSSSESLAGGGNGGGAMMGTCSIASPGWAEDAATADDTAEDAATADDTAEDAATTDDHENGWRCTGGPAAILYLLSGKYARQGL